MTDAVMSKFQGWLGKTPESIKGKMEWGHFEPKRWSENDVDIEVSHCGVCGSDLHGTISRQDLRLAGSMHSHVSVLKSGWGETPYPCVVGHEIVGKAIRVGKNVKHVKIGDRVGVGAQARSCLRQDCIDCSNGNENYCINENINTYGSIYPNDEGKSYGGYANYHRTNGHFVVPIPAELDSIDVAPMLCGGITVFTPLYQNGCGPGKTVAIVGVGGLGHFAVLFARALGADKVIGISRKNMKRNDVLELGANQYIATDEDADWAISNRRSVDLMLCTISSKDMPLEEYLQLLKAKGTFIQVG